MADTMDTTTKPHLLAIDVARRSNAVFVELATGEQRRVKMTNSAQDFDRLMQFIRLRQARGEPHSSPLATIIARLPTVCSRRESMW